jgi:hypothetical protein
MQFCKAAVLTWVASIVEGTSKDECQVKQRLLPLCHRPRHAHACVLTQPAAQRGLVPVQHRAALGHHICCVMRAVVRVAGVLLLDELHVAQDFGLVQLWQARVQAQLDVPRVDLIPDAALEGVCLQQGTKEAACLALKFTAGTGYALAALPPLLVSDALGSNGWRQLLTWYRTRLRCMQLHS